MLAMIMMGVGMMVEVITFDGYEELIEVVATRRLTSGDFGRWKWSHDTLAAAIFTEKSMESLKRIPFWGNFLMSAPKFACLAWSVWTSLSLCPICNLSSLYSLAQSS